MFGGGTSVTNSSDLPRLSAAGQTFTGFGTHAFNAGGVGNNSVRARNTSAGTGNFASFAVGNDTSATVLYMLAMSSTYTTAGGYIAGAGVIDMQESAGLSIMASHASGCQRWYAGGSADSNRFASLCSSLAMDFAGGASFGAGTKLSKGLVFSGVQTSTQSGATATLFSGEAAICNSSGAVPQTVHIRMAPASSNATVQGISSNCGLTGTFFIITNVSGSYTVAFDHESGSASPQNRILTATAATVTLSEGDSAGLIYDATTGRWRVIWVTQ